MPLHKFYQLFLENSSTKLPDS
jgi:Coatomer WD associated region